MNNDRKIWNFQQRWQAMLHTSGLDTGFSKISFFLFSMLNNGFGQTSDFRRGCGIPFCIGSDRGVLLPLFAAPFFLSFSSPFSSPTLSGWSGSIPIVNCQPFSPSPPRLRTPHHIPSPQPFSFLHPRSPADLNNRGRRSIGSYFLAVI